VRRVRLAAAGADPRLHSGKDSGGRESTSVCVRHVHDLHFLDLPARPASRILREADDAPPDASGAVTLPWPYTQAELVGLIGGSRQSVNRLLADLVARGLIVLERDALVIPDRVALERSILR
jgi:CRP-like cAMP-binding protein